MRYPIDGALVHKSAANQILLVAAESHAGGSLGLRVRLPSDHPFVHTVPANGTILGVELMRQCAIAFAHIDAGVPLGSAFLMNQIAFDWRESRIPESSEEFAGRVDVRLRAVKMRKDQVSDLQLEAEYVSRGIIVGIGHGDLSVLPPRAYQAIRRNAPPMPGEDTGPLGTVLSKVRQEPQSLEAELVWNLQDLFIFDHPSDHVPGMLLAKALLQAHQLLTGSQAMNFSLRCENFAEYNQPVRVTAGLTGPGQTLTTITQAKRKIAFGSCNGPWTACPAGPVDGEFRRGLTPTG